MRPGETAVERQDRLQREREAWLKNLEPGDTVAVRSASPMASRYVIDTVQSRTRYHIVLQRQGKFRRDDGYGVDRGMWHPHIEPVTDEVKDYLERIRITLRIGSLMHDLSEEIRHEDALDLDAKELEAFQNTLAEFLKAVTKKKKKG